MPDLFKTPGGAAVAEGTSPVEEAEVVQIDWEATVEAEHPDADANEILPIPPGGQTYLWKVSLLDRGEIENPKPGMTKDRKPFITVGLELELVDESSEFNGFKLSEYVTSLVMPRRGTSMLHHVMNCMGEVLPSSISLKALRDKVVETLTSSPSPLINAELEWKASRKNGPGKNDYEQVAQKMKQFPRNPEGDGYSQTYIWKNPKNPNDTQELRAFPYITKYIAQS